MEERGMTFLEERILNLMPDKKEDRKPMAYFRLHTNAKRREITVCLHELRKKYPICATRVSPGGYWMGNSEDIKETMKTLRNTYLTTKESYQYMRNHYFEMRKKEDGSK